MINKDSARNANPRLLEFPDYCFGFAGKVSFALFERFLILIRLGKRVDERNKEQMLKCGALILLAREDRQLCPHSFCAELETAKKQTRKLFFTRYFQRLHTCWMG